MVLERVRHPIVQAPMAGGPSTVELARAVSDAGGLGFLAAGYLRAAAVRDQIRELRAATDAPFGVNVFVPGAQAAGPRGGRGLPRDARRSRRAAPRRRRVEREARDPARGAPGG